MKRNNKRASKQIDPTPSPLQDMSHWTRPEVFNRPFRNNLPALGVYSLSVVAALTLSSCSFFTHRKPTYIAPEEFSPPSADILHTVSLGETLSCISRMYTGDSKNWARIAEYNRAINPNKLRTGTRLTIPAFLLASQEQIGKRPFDMDNNTPKHRIEEHELPLAASQRSTAKSSGNDIFAVNATKQKSPLEHLRSAPGRLDKNPSRILRNADSNPSLSEEANLSQSYPEPADLIQTRDEIATRHEKSTKEKLGADNLGATEMPAPSTRVETTKRSLRSAEKQVNTKAPLLNADTEQNIGDRPISQPLKSTPLEGNAAYASEKTHDLPVRVIREERASLSPTAQFDIGGDNRIENIPRGERQVGNTPLKRLNPKDAHPELQTSRSSFYSCAAESCSKHKF